MWAEADFTKQGRMNKQQAAGGEGGGGLAIRGRTLDGESRFPCKKDSGRHKKGSVKYDIVKWRQLDHCRRAILRVFAFE